MADTPTSTTNHDRDEKPGDSVEIGDSKAGFKKPTTWRITVLYCMASSLCVVIAHIFRVPSILMWFILVPLIWWYFKERYAREKAQKTVSEKGGS